MTIIIWNIQGLRSKLTATTIDYLKDFDIVVLMETFVEEKDCDKVSDDLPPTHNWTWLPAQRENVRGRAIAGLTIGHSRQIKTRNLTVHPKEWIMSMDLEIDDKWLTLIGVYNRKGMNRSTKNCIQDIIDKNPTRTIIAGDWNARIGQKGPRSGSRRHTKDTVTDGEGDKWLKLMTENDMTIMNGNMEGDWDGEFTHHSYKAMSVIDYAAISRLSEDTIRQFKIGERTESDHFPLEITLNTELDKTGEATLKMMRQFWTAGKKQDYSNNLTFEFDMDKWKDIEEVIWTANPLTEVKPRKTRHWFDKECYDARKKTEQALRIFRQHPEKEQEWRHARTMYKKQIKTSRDRERQLFKDKLDKVKTINDAWDFINSERPVKRKTTCKLDLNVLGQHFKTAMDGTDDARREQKERYLFTEIVTADEVKCTVQNMKEGKAAGPDNMRAESFIHGGDELNEAVARMTTRHINGVTIPDDWREGVIVPIYKKGPKDDPKNYRGITLVNVIYKLYSMLLLGRLTKELDDKKYLPDNQAAYRKGRSTIDNVYVTDKIVKSRIERGLRTYALFLDLRAAFDNVDRRRLFDKLRKVLSKYLVTAIEDIYELTPNRIGDMRFYTKKGLRQGCPLSPTLFSVYTADMENFLRRAQAGGVTIGRQRIFLLSYADDVVIFAEDPEQMKEVIRMLKKYFATNAMTPNIPKTKMMTFSKGGRLSKESWMWSSSEQIEEVRTFKYLGFTFSNNGGHGGHIDEVANDGNRRLTETWSIAERRFPDNFEIRMKMFDSLVLPVLTYGCEVFGREEFDEIEKLQRKYIKMTLGLRDSTRTTMIMYEARRRPLIYMTQTRADYFEKRAGLGDRKLLLNCVKWQTDRHRPRKCVKDYDDDTKKDFIGRPYEELAGEWEKLPKYLTTGREYKLIARGRMENMERGHSKWGDRRCRICGTDDETLDHMLDVCVPDDQGRTREEILNEEGTGRDYLCRLREILTDD